MPKQRTNAVRTFAFALLPVFFLSCTREVAFQGAGISFAVDNHWELLTSDPSPTDSPDGLCLPVLRERVLGPAPLIEVISIPSDLADPRQRAADFRLNMDTRPDAVKGSFVQREFATPSGLTGVHISFELKEKGLIATTRTHLYIFTNAQHRCVGIHYTTSPELDAYQVHRMITNTLRLR